MFLSGVGGGQKQSQKQWQSNGPSKATCWFCICYEKYAFLIQSSHIANVKYQKRFVQMHLIWRGWCGPARFLEWLWTVFAPTLSPLVLPLAKSERISDLLYIHQVAQTWLTVNANVAVCLPHPLYKVMVRQWALFRFIIHLLLSSHHVDFSSASFLTCSRTINAQLSDEAWQLSSVTFFFFFFCLSSFLFTGWRYRWRKGKTDIWIQPFTWRWLDQSTKLVATRGWGQCERVCDFVFV